MRCKICHN
ncbi:hypothetical protein R3I94_010299 [Phoxinus phoxinus]